MQVLHIMTRKPHLIDEEASILDAATKMQRTGCGILPVGRYEAIKGVITDRDIITRIIAQGKMSQKALVKMAMSINIFKCYEYDSLKNAVQLMKENRMRRILVFDEHSMLTGILSISDILNRVHDISLLLNLFAE